VASARRRSRPRLECRLDRGDAPADDLRDCLQGIAEDIAQDDAATLGHRQPHAGPEGGLHDLTILNRLRFRWRSSPVPRLTAGLARPPAGAGSPKQRCGRRETANLPDWRSTQLPGPPRSPRAWLLELRPRHHDRARHPCAVAVQPGPKLAQQLLQRLLWHSGRQLAVLPSDMVAPPWISHRGNRPTEGEDGLRVRRPAHRTRASVHPCRPAPVAAGPPRRRGHSRRQRLPLYRRGNQSEV
jgi:hypothetical protein